jgi:hypothetical protein
MISFATTSIPPASEDHARPRTARNLPATLTAAPARIRAPTSRAPSPAITTPSLKDSRPSPQSTSILITGVPVGVVRTSGGESTLPSSSILFRLTREIRLRLDVRGSFLKPFGHSLLRYFSLTCRLLR